MKDQIKNSIENVLIKIGAPSIDFDVEHPADLSHGDYATNAPLVYAKQLGMNPKELAQKIIDHLKAEPMSDVEKIEIAGPGFINFYLSKEFFQKSIKGIVEGGDSFGQNGSFKGRKVIVEYTDPNVMKPFHIGHFMSNAIGESLSRIVEWSGANVVRANYYSDSGLSIAKAVWGVMAKKSEIPGESAELGEKAKFLGRSYAFGVSQSSDDEKISLEVREINKKIFDRSDPEVNEVYDLGKRWSLEYFEELYKRLGSSFDWSIGESEVSGEGKKIVLDFLDKGVFEQSEGAVVFHGEKYDPKLHTRVFINKENLPTYEAKELGLTKKKFEIYNPDLSIVVTANEQNDYFKVVIEAMKHIFPEIASKTKHLSHGVLRLPTGKMSSRTGDVITAESLIDQVKGIISEKGDIAKEEVAIGAIKYMILRQSIGNDIVFDMEKSVSTEGDSGVYLQYAFVRTNSILEKASESAMQVNPSQGIGDSNRDTHEIERILYRFPEVVERAMKEYAPNYILTYLTEIAGSFNNLYATEQIISDKPESSYLIAVTRAFNIVMKNGLAILGIPAPTKM
jgi:arginyl-tRNA synthetase